MVGMWSMEKVWEFSREYNYTQHDFVKIQKLIYEHAGILLSSTKQNMVYSRLLRRLHAHGFSSFNEYLRLLEEGDEVEWEAFTNSLTTNLTGFFREEHHFPLLEQHVLMRENQINRENYDFLSSDQNPQQRKNKHKIHLWCSAVSTGEEAYSMAMTMVKAFKTFSPPVHILATDLNSNVLTKAKQGVYSMDKLEKLPKDMLKQFFLKGKGRNAGLAKVRKELRDMVTFRKLNLLEKEWPIRGPFEAIFCRNIMIYFDQNTQYQILKKFAPLLASEGLLFAGHSENFHHAPNLFKLRSKTVYVLAKKENVKCMTEVNNA